jgi:hypothetical protein
MLSAGSATSRYFSALCSETALGTRQTHDTGTVSEHIAAAVERNHCWLTTMASDRIIATMTWIPLLPIVLSSKSDISESSFQYWLTTKQTADVTARDVREDHLWNFSVL